MKKIAVIGVLMFALAVSPVFAVQKDYAVTCNPLGFLIGAFNVAGNYAMSPEMSITAGGSYFGYESGDDEFSIIGLSGGVRYYWAGQALNGWYVGGLLTYQRISVDVTVIEYTYTTYGGYTYATGMEETTGSASASAIGIGALVGYQSIWDSGFTLDSGIGVQKVTLPGIKVETKGASGTVYDDYTSEEISLTLPIIQLSVGYAF